MARTTGWPLPLEFTPSFVARTRRLRGAAESVPTLTQALDALPEDKILAVDIKTPWSVLALRGPIAKRGIAERTLVWCSSGLAVRYAVQRNPGWEVAHYKDLDGATANRGFVAAARRLGARGVSLDWRAVDADLVAYAHEVGIRVYSWHKEYELTEAKLASGLDGLITDHPAKARHTLGIG
jgi:glycerophosphoryl diester phosphodiesterase